MMCALDCHTACAPCCTQQLCSVLTVGGTLTGSRVEGKANSSMEYLEVPGHQTQVCAELHKLTTDPTHDLPGKQLRGPQSAFFSPTLAFPH